MAKFGLLLRDSPYKGSANYEHVLSAVSEVRGNEPARFELVRLVEKAALLTAKP